MNKFIKLMNYYRDHPAEWIKDFYMIKDSQTGEELKLKLWDFQEEFVNSFKTPANPNGYRFHLVLKSRQLGMSTTTLALILHKAMFQKNCKIVIACKKLNDASKMLTDEIYFALDSLPEFMKPAIKERNKNRVHFESSNSWIQAVAATPGALRQYQATHVVFDEFAFYNDIKADLDYEMYRAALPSFQRSGFCTIISTPNGLGNMYGEYVNKARNGMLDKNWWYKELKWDVRKDRLYNQDTKEYDGGESFKASVINQPNGKRIWDAEYDCQLLASGNPVFDTELLALTIKPQQPAIKRQTYYIGADVAGGAGQDYSVAQVLDSDGNQVYVYRSNDINPKDFGDVLTELGRRYNNAIIAVERNNHGLTTITQLQNNKYRNLYKHTDGNYGFITTAHSKPEIIFDLERMLRQGYISLSDKTTLEELMIFQHTSSKTSSSGMSAPNGKHDDCVMSLAIAAMLLNKRASNKVHTSNQNIL